MLKQVIATFVKTLQIIVIGSIRAYRWLISPWLPGCCRFYPTCSQYAINAVESHGVAKGMYLTIRRIVRCHPGSAGGVDLVPLKKKEGRSGH